MCHFLAARVNIDSRVEDLITGLVGLNLFERLGGILKHSKLAIAVRGNYLLLPASFQGMGDSSEEDKKRLCGDPSDQQESARRDGQH